MCLFCNNIAGENKPFRSVTTAFALGGESFGSGGRPVKGEYKRLARVCGARERVLVVRRMWHIRRLPGRLAAGSVLMGRPRGIPLTSVSRSALREMSHSSRAQGRHAAHIEVDAARPVPVNEFETLVG